MGFIDGKYKWEFILFKLSIQHSRYARANNFSIIFLFLYFILFYNIFILRYAINRDKWLRILSERLYRENRDGRSLYWQSIIYTCEIGRERGSPSTRRHVRETTLTGSHDGIEIPRRREAPEKRLCLSTVEDEFDDSRVRHSTHAARCRKYIFTTASTRAACGSVH